MEVGDLEDNDSKFNLEFTLPDGRVRYIQLAPDANGDLKPKVYKKVGNRMLIDHGMWDKENLNLAC